MTYALATDEGMSEHTRPPDSSPPRVDEWFDEALPRIYGYFITRVGGQQTVAEDLTQETLLAAVRSSTGPDDPGPILPWLYGIARHKLMDHYRQQDRESRFAGRPLPDHDAHADALSLPDPDLESFPARHDIIETLAALHPRHRSMIVLRYLDDCDMDTIARSLFISTSAANSLLSRARNAFRAEYQRRNGGQ